MSTNNKNNNNNAPQYPNLNSGLQAGALLFGPRQLGVGIRGGCEAAIHSARRYLQSLAPGHIMVKLDFANAFNSLHRSDMLLSVRDRLPELYAFCLSSYSQPSFLYFGSHVILSQEGPQQGDPLGPLLFCSTIHPLISSLSSDLTLGYLDDLTLAGPQSVVAADIQQVMAEGSKMGLCLNLRSARSFLIQIQISLTKPCRRSLLSVWPMRPYSEPRCSRAKFWMTLGWHAVKI